jgi:hypothetical protein
MKEIIARFMPANFNDLLALGGLVIIPAIWLSQAIWKFSISAEVNGALIVTWSLVWNFYFRKAKDELPKGS